MAGIFKWMDFSDLDINDPFFDSLKADYEEFPTWFAKKSSSGAQALVSIDDVGVSSFLYLKEENEDVELQEAVLHAEPRIKIGTFKLSERTSGNRQGEGTLGIALWRWQQMKVNQIYVTIFEKHDVLIRLFEKYGFILAGHNTRGELVYVKDRRNIDWSDAYKAFPFIHRGFGHAFLLPIDDVFHDQLFPYSGLYRNGLEVEEIAAGNGMSKVFIGSPFQRVSYEVGKPILVYRIHTGTQKKTYASCITSFCTIQGVTWVKTGGMIKKSFDDFKTLVRNKAVFTEQELREIYDNKRNIVVLELAYNGYFGPGHNVIHHWLDENGLFPDYPYQIKYTEDEFIRILQEAEVDVQNVVVD